MVRAEIEHKIYKTFDQLMEQSENLILDLQKRELVYNGDEITVLRKREKDFLHLLYKRKNENSKDSIIILESLTITFTLLL